MSAPRRTCSTCGGQWERDVLFCPIDGTPVSGDAVDVAPDPRIGLELDGQIRLERLVGRGAMARVYRGWQAGVERPVAVKVLRGDLARDPQYLARFAREARVAGRIEHEHVIRVLFAGALPAHAGATPFLATEWLDGVSLRTALAASGGALPFARARSIVRQVCAAVGEAHALGVVHRDIKPENVMLVRRRHERDFVKLLDFGLARTGEGDPEFATHTGAVLGSARYISPEGASGAAVGPPADVYALATLFYELLAGRTPFDGANAVAVLIAHSREPPPPLVPHALAGHVPAAVLRVVEANLAKRPEARAPDAWAFGAALEDAAGGGAPASIAAPATHRGA